MATDTLEGVNAELEKVRKEIDGQYSALRGMAGGGAGPADGARMAEAICKDLDALFTRRGALLRRRAEFPSGVDPAAG